MSTEVQDHFVLMLGLAHDVHFLKAKLINAYLPRPSTQKVTLISLRLSGFLFLFKFCFGFSSVFEAKPRNTAHRSIGA